MYSCCSIAETGDKHGTEPQVASTKVGTCPIWAQSGGPVWQSGTLGPLTPAVGSLWHILGLSRVSQIRVSLHVRSQLNPSPFFGLSWLPRSATDTVVTRRPSRQRILPGSLHQSCRTHTFYLPMAKPETLPANYHLTSTQRLTARELL